MEKAAATDWDALFRAVPEDLQFDGKRMVSRNHQAICEYRAAAEEARTLLRSSFGDSRPTGDDVDPANLADAARAVENAIISGQTHDKIHGVLGQSFKRGVAVLGWWLGKARHIVDTTEAACARFEKAEAKLNEVLANVSPKEPAPSDAKMYIPRFGPPPVPYGGTSYTDFDVRDLDAPKPKSDGVTVTVVGESAGLRVGGAR